jgi:Xaa-Pro dipeptidase
MVARKAGHLGLLRLRSFNMDMYFGHVLSGPEAAVASYADTSTGGAGLSAAFSQGPSRRRIKAGEIVSVDTMMNYHGYLNDQTRNYCIGSPPTRLQEAYRLSLDIHHRFKERATPGAATGELYEEILGSVDDAGWSQYFMGHGESRVSFVGHGLGLEVDEFPLIAQGQKLTLKEGMIVAFEPKFIVPGLCIAGMENTYVITSNGPVSLNTAPEDLSIL